MFAYGQTVTIVRESPGGTDPYGDPIPGTTSRIDVPGCGVDARTSSEPTERGRAGVIVGLMLFAPAGTVILSTDQVEVGGELFAVDGIASAPVNPFTGWAPGVEVALRKAVG